MEHDLDIRLIQHGSAEYEETVALRDAVLRRPLGLVFTPEVLGEESDQLHLACYRDGRLVGCLLLKPVDASIVKMRQVAVADDAQRLGVGTAMVEASERLARELGFRTMELNARLSAVPFYERLAYAPVGDMFEEVTIPHMKMAKDLTRNDPG